MRFIGTGRAPERVAHALMAHPEWLSSDGFHPNELGYAAVARVFEDAYRRNG